MAEIDFLPKEYWQRRASMRDQWYLLGIGALVLVLLVGTMVNQSGQTARLRARLKGLTDEQSERLVQVSEVERLEARRATLAADAKFYCLLHAHASISRIAVAVATNCPERLTLNSMHLKPVTTGSVESKASSAAGRSAAAAAPRSAEEVQQDQLQRFAADRELTQMTLEIKGVAESEREVADLVDRLKRLEYFASVEVVDVIEHDSSGSSPLRSFEILCRVSKVL